MIWFNIKKLERKLASGNSSDKMAYQYFLAFLIVTVALAFFPKSAAGSSAISIAVLLVNLVVIIWGISKTMEININRVTEIILKDSFPSPSLPAHGWLYM